MKRYLPERFNETNSLFDAFDSLFKPVFFDETKDMRTDIKETEKGYSLDIEMPGFKKENLSVSLEDGYLTVSGTKRVDKDDKTKYLRKEISESFQRSYYVGKDVTEESIKAKYADGILSLDVPKSTPKKIQARTINIE